MIMAKNSVIHFTNFVFQVFYGRKIKRDFICQLTLQLGKNNLS